jgi:hypothetical protein
LRGAVVKFLGDVFEVFGTARQTACRSQCSLRAIKLCVALHHRNLGMPDGEYCLGSQHVTKCLGGVRLADGALAGNTLTIEQALRNLVSLDLSIADVSNRMSRYAADYLGIDTADV